MKLYREIYEENLKIMSEIESLNLTYERKFEIFSQGNTSVPNEALLIRPYRDPDGYAFDENSGYKLDAYRRRISENGILLTTDGLLSIQRIYKHEQSFSDFIQAYERYRKHPIIFFPSERGGINSCRALCRFDDRIDHTLFSLKCYFD